MKKSLIMILGAIASLSIQAKTYYFSDCQVGADASCKVGDDSKDNDGTSPTRPKRSLPSPAFVDSLVAGDQVLLARNGSWRPALSAFWTGNNKGTAANPIVIGDYTPQGYTGTAKPLISITEKNSSCLVLSNGGMVPVHKAGYIFKNIKCIGPGANTNATGIFTYNDVSDVLLENLDISGFGIGVYPGKGNAVGATTARLTLRNSFIHDNGGQGLFGFGAQLLIENNRFDNNGFVGSANRPLGHYHNIYVADVEDSVIRGNTLTRSAVCTSKTLSSCVTQNKCNGVSLVVHGVSSNLAIENNIINEPNGAEPGCYGIQVAPGSYGTEEKFIRTTIRGNKVVNLGGVAIDVGAAPHSLIEDNVIVWTKSPQASLFGIVVPSGNANTQKSVVDTDITVRNNSIYMSGNSNYSVGITLNKKGEKHRVVNNLIYFAKDASPQARCFDHQGLDISKFEAFDYNVCYSNRIDHLVKYSTDYPSLVDAKKAKFDMHGLNTDPMIAIPAANNLYSMPLLPNSQLRNVGHPTLSKRLGYGGAYNPDERRFIGAYPTSVDSIAPASPRPYTP